MQLGEDENCRIIKKMDKWNAKNLVLGKLHCNFNVISTRNLCLPKNIHHYLSISAQSKDKDKEEFECPPNVGNGNFADPVTCRRFYQVSYF